MDITKKYKNAYQNASVVIEKCTTQASDQKDVVCLCLQSAVFIITETLKTIGEKDRKKMLNMWDEVVQYVDAEVNYGFEENE